MACSSILLPKSIFLISELIGQCDDYIWLQSNSKCWKFYDKRKKKLYLNQILSFIHLSYWLFIDYYTDDIGIMFEWFIPYLDSFYTIIRALFVSTFPHNLYHISICKLHVMNYTVKDVLIECNSDNYTPCYDISLYFCLHL